MAAGADRVVELEVGEWYVLKNWLRDRENQLMYTLGGESDLNVLRAIREDIESQLDDDRFQHVVLAEWEWKLVCSFLRRRARYLFFKPWRDRERQEVRHLRRHILDQLSKYEGREVNEGLMTDMQ